MKHPAHSRSFKNSNSLPSSPWPLHTLPSLPLAIDVKGLFRTECLLENILGWEGNSKNSGHMREDVTRCSPGKSRLVYNCWSFKTNNFAGSSGSWECPKKLLAVGANWQPICASFIFWCKFPKLTSWNKNISTCIWGSVDWQADPASTLDGGALSGAPSLSQNIYHYTLHNKNGLNHCESCRFPDWDARRLIVRSTAIDKQGFC